MPETSMEAVRSWDKLPEETNKAWAAFQVYLSLPTVGAIDDRRSLRNTAARLGLASTTSVEVWSAKYNWGERVRAYDAYTGAKHIDLREVGIVDLQQAVVASLSIQLTGMNEVIEKRLMMMRKELDEGHSVPVQDIKRMLEAIAVKDDLARRMANLPTSYTSERATDTIDEDTVFIIGAE